MREIKFRAWDHGTNAWHNFNATDFSFNPIPPLDVLYLTSTDGQCNIEQHTGLQDRNGVDIYEGDVVYLAGYGKYTAELPFTELYEGYPEDDIGDILGNIHQHPELLEDK